MSKLLPLTIWIVAFGLIGSDIEPLLAQSETVPAGSSRAFTPPIDQRGYHRRGVFLPRRVRVRRHRRF